MPVDIFKNGKKFRPRTSSANWSGSDKLTVKEMHHYNREMGYQ